MSVSKSEKQELLEKLNELLKRQSIFNQQIHDLEKRIVELQTEELLQNSENENVQLKRSVTESSPPKKYYDLEKSSNKRKSGDKRVPGKNVFNAEIEKFIGENLVSKIGIAVLIIGVGIGTKYAIDNNLISPLVRIILGYLVGLGLAFFAIRLKRKYLNFSAVLFSGAMAIHYFISYAAYNYYHLFHERLAIVLMVLITILTVVLALYYNRQVIAHFGLVGAYIVPFLLKDPFINATILFIYILIINTGILYISTRKKWKSIYYLAGAATWIIFISWFASSGYDNQLGKCLTFLTLFFMVFYLAFLSYRLLFKESFRVDDVLFLLLNALIFYTIGYIAIDYVENGHRFIGLFTFTNTIIYGITALLIFRPEVKDKHLFYWTAGLAIVSFTAAVAFQFNDKVTAIIWSVEAAYLFWVGRTKNSIVFERIAYGIIFSLFILIIMVWTSVSYVFADELESLHLIQPVFNFRFLTSLVVICSFSFIYYVNLKFRKKGRYTNSPIYLFNLLFPLVLLLTIYFTFFSEISLYWENILYKTSFGLNNDGVWVSLGHRNNNLEFFKTLWLINYSMLFVSLLAFANFRWFRNINFNKIILGITFFIVFLFLTAGLTEITMLRKNYLNPGLIPYYDKTIFYILIRYFTYLFFGLLIYSINKFTMPLFTNARFKIIFEVVFVVSLIWLSSSELINWLELSGSTKIYKHGLSILWGLWSFVLVGYGIWKRKKHFRITAIALLAVTLLKLFFYDLTYLETVPKTIVFVCIGILLLVVSFLYNKYKNIMYDENEIKKEIH